MARSLATQDRLDSIIHLLTTHRVSDPSEKSSDADLLIMQMFDDTIENVANRHLFYEPPVHYQHQHSFVIPKQDLLEFYALSQQAMYGNCNTQRPHAKFMYIFSIDPVSGEKWDAWNDLKNKLTTLQAKQRYLLKFARFLRKQHDLAHEADEWVRLFANRITQILSSSEAPQDELLPSQLLSFEKSNLAPLAFAKDESIDVSFDYTNDYSKREIITIGELRQKCGQMEDAISNEVKVLNQSLKESLKRLSDLELAAKIDGNEDDEKLAKQLDAIKLQFAHEEDQSIASIADNVQVAYKLLYNKVKQSTGILDEQQQVIEKTLAAICKEQGEISKQKTSSWSESLLVIGVPMAIAFAVGAFSLKKMNKII